MAPKAENIGTCETCGSHFRYEIFDSVMGDFAYAYCGACGRTTVLRG